MDLLNLYNRKTTRVVHIGGVAIGGSNPVAIQSMTNTDTRNAAATIAQINALAAAGCEIARVAVPDAESAGAIKQIKAGITIPLVADIHFDYRLALLSMQNGVDKLRINPGNIGSEDNIKTIVDMAKERKIPIRIGVNSGSLEKDIVKKYNGVTAEGLVESAMRHVEILERMDFADIVISIKGSNIPLTLRAHELLSAQTDYPLHIGITESGTVYAGSVKSAAGMGAILTRGIGDTMRVSLTGDPVEEIKCAREILKSLGLRQFGIEFISCPTCGRTEIDLIGLANEVERRCAHLSKPIKIAVMGCVVNGPGEAKEADIGIAGGKGCGIIFKKGEVVRKVDEKDLLAALLEEIEKVI